MKHSQSYPILFLILLFLSGRACAADLGQAQLRSNLGEPFRAQLLVSGVSAGMMLSSCFSARVETIDGALLASPRVDLDGYNASSQSVLVRFGSAELISEPAVKLTVGLICGIALERVYPLLLDYPEMAGAMDAQNDPADAAVVVPPKPAAAARERTDTAKKTGAGRITNPDSKISTGPMRHKDALKISNEDMSAPVLAPQAPLKNTEQQRLAQNRQAQQAFTEMLSDESELARSREELKKEKAKVQNLEKEVHRLRLDFQLGTQKENTIQVLLITLNFIVMIVFSIVVGVLVMLLRKARRSGKSSWSAASFEQRNVPGNAAAMQDAESEADEADWPKPAVQSAAMNSCLTGLKQDQNLSAAQPDARPGDAHSQVLPSNAFNLFSTARGQSILIEEVSDAMQEAQFWTSIHDPQRAIEILEPQAAIENPSTPVMWLLLLDQYRMIGDGERFNRLRARLKQKFNTHIPEISEAPSARNMAYLCDFEHLTSRLCAFWNTNYILPFLESLLIDDRDGERVGFELSVYQDILMLVAICRELEKPAEAFSV